MKMTRRVVENPWTLIMFRTHLPACAVLIFGQYLPGAPERMRCVVSEDANAIGLIFRVTGELSRSRPVRPHHR
jgi:hypothetical protein